jgi:large subunit ribosomal protein L6
LGKCRSVAEGVSVIWRREHYSESRDVQQQFPPEMTFTIEGSEVQVTRPTDAKNHRALHGLSRALLSNMVTGVNTGFKRVLEVEGVGYRAGILNKNLVVLVGYSHPVEIVPPPNIAFEVDKTGRIITITGIDKSSGPDGRARSRFAPARALQGQGHPLPG